MRIAQSTLGRAAAAAFLASGVAGCPDANPVDGIKTQVEARQAAPVIIDDAQAVRAVQAYQAQKGENPPSIEALEAVTGKLPKLPATHEYRYDPATAKIE